MFDRFKEALRPKRKELKEDADIDFEKGDFLAILIAAFTTIVPAVIAILGIFYFLMWLIFLR